MAKYKRTVIGSVLKSKNPGELDYIKIKDAISFAAGDTISLESRESRLASIDKALAEGKMDEDMAAKIRDSVDKMPTFVRFNLVKVSKE